MFTFHWACEFNSEKKNKTKAYELEHGQQMTIISHARNIDKQFGTVNSIDWNERWCNSRKENTLLTQYQTSNFSAKTRRINSVQWSVSMYFGTRYILMAYCINEAVSVPIFKSTWLIWAGKRTTCTFLAEMNKNTTTTTAIRFHRAAIRHHRERAREGLCDLKKKNSWKHLHGSNQVYKEALLDSHVMVYLWAACVAGNK